MHVLGSPGVAAGVVRGCMVAACLLVIFQTGTVFCETVEEAKEREWYSYDNGSRKSYILVTPSRYEKELSKTDVPAAVLDREKIDEKAPRSMGELLSSAPGVYAAEDGALSTGKPVMRGFYGNRVLVMVDGQRLQSSLGGIWGGPDVSLVDPDQLEQAEIVYGPSSSLYGSDALGGAINLITRKAKLSDLPYTNGQINSYYVTNGKGNKEYVRAEAGGAKAAVGVGVTNRQMNDYHAPDEKMQDSGYKMKSGSLDVTFSPLPGHTLLLTAQANRNNDLDRPEQFSDSAATKIETTKYDRTKIGLDYTWANVTRTLKKLSLRSYYQKDESEFTFNGDIHPIPGLKIKTASKGDSELKTFGLQGQTEFGFDRWYSVVGFDYYYNSSGPNETCTRTQTNIFGIRRPEEFSKSIAEDGKADSLGIFWQNEFSLTDRLTVTPGLRYDWYRSRITSHEEKPLAYNRSSSDNALTWSLSLAYALTDSLRPYVNVCRGFRAPSLRDLYYQGVVPGGLMSRGNPALDPETSTTWNAGFKINSGRVQGSLTVFRSDVDDMIISVTKPRQQQGDPPAGVVVKENLGKARLWGGEAFMRITINPQWSYNFQFSYTQGKDMVNRWPLQAVPPARLVQSLRWDGRFSAARSLPLWAEVTCRYRFRQNRIARDWDKDKAKTPGVAIWDLRGGIDLPRLLYSKKSECFAGITNITDKRYTEVPLYDGYDLLTMPGISATIGLKLLF